MYPVAIPTKVEEAFKAFRYVPYVALTPAARQRAARGEEEFTFNIQGGIVAKGLDRRNEKSISAVEWYAASHAAEELTSFYHGKSREEDLTAHHRHVMDLACSHTWEVAMEYDIQQREAVARNPVHDLSTIDHAALTIIATRIALAPTLQQSSSPPKRPSVEPALSVSKKKQRTDCLLCFQCRGSAHFPADCKADRTCAGKPVAPLAPNAKSKHALLSPNGKPYCFNWALSASCKFGSKCANTHGCSLCNEPSHGAGGCSTLG